MSPALALPGASFGSLRAVGVTLALWPALQGAVQKNIERGLARLSQLSAGAGAASRP